MLDRTIPNSYGVIPEDEALDKQEMSTGRDEVRNSFAIMLANAQEWKALAEYLNTPAGVLGFLAPNSSIYPPDLFQDPMRRLMNFLASANALVYHTRNHVTHVYKQHSFREQYQQEVERVFYDDFPRFIVDLRNFTLHHSLPLSRASVTLASPPVFRFLLTKQRLQTAGYKWTARPRRFIDGPSDEIAVTPLVDQYVESAMTFICWRECREQELVQRALLAQNVPNSLVSRRAGWVPVTQ